MTSELGRRVAFTIGALLVYRLGTYIPLPGIDPDALAQLFRPAIGGSMGSSFLYSGVGIHRVAIFALNLVPYVTAAILLQLLSMALPPLRGLTRQGARGRRRLRDYTIGLTVALAAFQSFGIAVALEGVPNFVIDPGSMTRLTMTLTLTGGTLFLVWLSAQITTRGIGNGIALILALGIVLELPSAIAGALELNRQRVLSSDLLFGLAALALALTGLVVVMERATRRLPVEYARREIGTRMIEGRSFIPVKLNGAGIIPPLLASYFLFVPVTLASHIGDEGPLWLTKLGKQLEQGQPLYIVFYALVIILIAFFYSAFLLDPERAAGDLAQHGGTIAGIEPGEATAAHIDNVLTRTTMLGSAYLALVCVVPEILISYAQVPFYFGGTSFLVVVCTILDLDAQLAGRAVA